MSSSTIVAPLYQANGLATGLDDTQIVQELVQADSAPLTQMQTEQWTTRPSSAPWAPSCRI